MPLIPFPDVPPVAGVPDLNRLPLAVGVLTGVTQALQGPDYFGWLPGDTPQWILCDDQGNALVTPDAVVDLGFRGEQRVASYPVEQGAFASYKKVAQPQELTLRRDVFLLELGSLLGSLTLVNVTTPDETYRGYNLDRLDYQRRSSAGLSLIVAEIHLTEIRTSAQASYSNTAQPSGNDPQIQGWVCTAAELPTPTNRLTPVQQAAASMHAMFANAQQSVEKIETTAATQLTQGFSGVATSLESAVSGVFA
ncbi:hypothetical protein NOV72_02115 [Caballeronia novacaledonica]|uniref:Phage tail protein n=1 Tax=Caballeronia novacaledonica TaxID=1544861 RepID=A0A2U3I444_9BURK|nr:hypothetical protein [Caballeronia novacaledonica]SPB14884.1 hypothetical protein NOV72_02115 [Caballeronia novacaledonica]